MTGELCPKMYLLTFPEHVFQGIWISVAKIAKIQIFEEAILHLNKKELFGTIRLRNLN